MRVYRCDGCGKHVKWKDSYKIEIQAFPPFSFASEKHLCDRCCRILCGWLKAPGDEEPRELLGYSEKKEEE